MKRDSIPKQRIGRKKLIFRWIKIIILLYCSIGITLYYLQGKFLFHPHTLPNDYIFKFSQPFREYNIDINKSERLNIVEFLNQTAVKKGSVIYFHGNMDNIEHYAGLAENFTKRGFNVWMPDYAGFGKSTGILTEAKMYQEAQLVYQLATKAISADSIIIYGKSLGTGVAAQLASVASCKRLILETPYFSIASLFSTYAPIFPTSSMCHFKLPTAEYLKHVTVPVTIFHGTSDNVIPFRSSYRLNKILKTGDKFITIEGGNHNNLNNFALYHQQLDSLLH